VEEEFEDLDLRRRGFTKDGCQLSEIGEPAYEILDDLSGFSEEFVRRIQRLRGLRATAREKKVCQPFPESASSKQNT
jgi:hypothetical protein